MSNDNEKITVIQGNLTDIYEVSPFENGEAVATLSDAGWSCRSVLVENLGDIPLIDNTVTLKTIDDLYYRVAFEPDDTTPLAIGTYIWIIQVENSTVVPKYRREKQISLTVEAQGLA